MPSFFPAVRVALAAALAAGSLQAQAHAYLQRSEPPANAVVAKAPQELRLRFSEAVEPAFVDIRLLRNGKAVDGIRAATVDKDGKTVRVGLPAGVDAGAADYEVRWRIVAKDGHPTEGRYPFRVAVR